MNSGSTNFRVWDCDKGCYRLAGGEGIFVITQDGFLGIWKDRESADLVHDKSRFIVERCTGFTDSNGRLIYQGDIIERRNEFFPEKKFRRAIYFVPHYARFYEVSPVSGIRYPLDADSAEEFRVIGNINENSELLGLKTHYERFEK